MGWKEFCRSEDGVSLVFVTMTLPVLMGFALLATDASRVYNLGNDLQNGADALALAAAAELDGGLDAIERADRALANLVENEHSLSDLGVHTLTTGDITWRYLKSLPGVDGEAGTDDTPIPVADETTDGAEAIYVEVTINPTNITSIFPASFLTGVAGDNVLAVSATAVAGFRSSVCNFTPVFMCNPYENPANVGGITLAEAVADRSYRRRLIELRAVGGGADYFPGNFGFLESPGGSGARVLAESIASSRPQACFWVRGVNTKTGQNSGPVKAAFNIRFGIQDHNFGNDPQYGPAANVRKGAVRKTGSLTACPRSNQLDWDDPDNVELKADPCFVTDTCPYMGGRMGDGDWDACSYWTANHSNPVTPFPGGWSCAGANKPTRYEVYRYEIQNNLVGDPSLDSPRAETGTPPTGCGAPVTSVDRRLLYGALLNCQALEAAGYNLGGHEVGLPAEAFASFFITEPVRKEPHSEYDASVFVELVDVTGAAGGGTLDAFQRDDVVLYR